MALLLRVEFSIVAVMLHSAPMSTSSARKTSRAKTATQRFEPLPELHSPGAPQHAMDAPHAQTPQRGVQQPLHQASQIYTGA